MSVSLCTLCLSVFVVPVCVFCIPTPSACFPFIPSSPGSRGAAVIGNVLSGRQSGVALRPSCCSPTTPSSLHRVSISRLPLHGVSPEGAPVLSEPLDVPVFLAENGDLVLEQDGVQSHLGVDQRHGTKPAGKLVHAGLPLGKVVWICPARRPRRLLGGRDNSFIIRVFSHFGSMMSRRSEKTITDC